MARIPVLLAALWLLGACSSQVRLMPTPTDEQAARMQKMMMFMPVMMGFFLYNYAAGLSLYMITQSGLGILENTVIKKVWPIDDSEPVKSADSKGWIQRLMERAQEAQRAQQRRSSGSSKGGKKK